MSARDRQKQILDILEEKGHVTVQYLVSELHYSSATINRDLNALQSRQLCVRSHGGAEPVHSRYVPVFFRSHKMRAEKRSIGRAAAAFVHDGETIFIDGSTTAQCMEPHLIHRRNLTVVTNNMILAANLSAHGVGVICLGGPVAEPPSMLCGPETVENAAHYRVDKMFFATRAMSSDGLIASAGHYHLLFQTIARNAKEVFYLVDHEKIDQPFSMVYCDLNGVDCVVSDWAFPEALKKQFAKTRFVSAGNAAPEQTPL